MSQLGERLGVNKSTIQRYESNGVDPKKNYLIISIADALETNGALIGMRITEYNTMSENGWNLMKYNDIMKPSQK